MAEPYFADQDVTLYLDKCEKVLPDLPADSVDACLTDPPYGLSELPRKQVEAALRAWLAGDRLHVPDGRGFMGQEWDRFVPPPGVWDEVYRVLKPGAYLMAFAAPRTYDLMGLSIRLAGFEVQDSIDWIFGTGFPKSRGRLKPAHEPIILAWKPAKYATELPGLDACKVAHANDADLAESEGKNRHADFGSGPRDNHVFGADERARAEQGNYDGSDGRWPPNVVLTHLVECRPAGLRQVRNHGHGPAARGAGGISTSGHRGQDGLTERRLPVETVEAWDCVPGCPVGELDRQSGVTKSSGGKGEASMRTALGGAVYGDYAHTTLGASTRAAFGDTGGASRFFPVFRYEAKAPSSERPRLADGTAWSTVKPLGFMRWAARLIVPQGGTCLDPFAGTFTTAEACIVEGFPCIAIDKDEKALRLGMERLSKPIQPVLFGEAG